MRAGSADDPHGPIALLPLAALADPERFAAIAAGLRQAGWTVGLATPDAVALDWVAQPGLVWAAPAAAAPPPHPPGRLIALGPPQPWCRAPGILHEGLAA